MNKRALRKLVALGYVSGVLSCCSFIGAMKNEKNNGAQKPGTTKSEKDIRKKSTKEVLKDFLLEHERKLNRKGNKKSTNEVPKYTKANEAVDILFDRSLSYGALYRLRTAFEMFRDMSSDEKKSFIKEVIKYAGPGSEFNIPFFTDDIDWKNSQFKRDNDFDFEICEKRGGYFSREHAGFDCEERFLGDKDSAYAGIGSILDLWDYEPDSPKFKSTDKIEVDAYIGYETGYIRIGTHEDLFDNPEDKKNNCWTLRIIKYD